MEAEPRLPFEDRSQECSWDEVCSVWGRGQGSVAMFMLPGFTRHGDKGKKGLLGVHSSTPTSLWPPEWVWLDHDTSLGLLWGQNLGKAWWSACFLPPSPTACPQKWKLSSPSPPPGPQGASFNHPAAGDSVTTHSLQPVLRFPKFTASCSPRQPPWLGLNITGVSLMWPLPR